MVVIRCALITERLPGQLERSTAGASSGPTFFLRAAFVRMFQSSSWGADADR